MSLRDSTKQFAVVTGASSGIGLELAKKFAENGFDVLIAADDDGIFEAEKRIKVIGNAEAIQVNLATFEGVHALYTKIKETGRPVDAIALNAGVGVSGAFIQTDLEEELNMINLNIVSVVHLAKHVIRDMAKAGKGRVLLTASIASTNPSPFLAVYAATKAFILSFAEGIRNELKDTGVTVTALMPGATNTNFFERAGMEDTQAGTKGKFENEPADVAKQGYDAMMNGKDHVVAASLMTKIQGIMSELMPETVKAAMSRKALEPGSARAS